MHAPRRIRKPLRLGNAARNSACVLALIVTASLHAQTTLYWDTNGKNTAGAGGPSPNETWTTTGSGKNWNTDSAGLGSANTVAWTSGAAAVFSAGTDATGAYTVTVSGTQNVASISVEEGALTITAGTLNFNGASPTISVTTGLIATIASTITGTTGLNVNGAGTLALTGTANTYTGVTTISGGGILAASSLASGSSSSIGGASDAASNLVLDGGTLGYSGATASTNRLFTLGAGGGTLDSSATSGGTITFANTGSIAFTGGTGARTLTLTGASNGVLASVIADNTGATSLTKAGTGTWALTSSNSFTGQTNIQAGTLSVTSISSVGGGASSLGAPTTVANGTIGLGSGTTTGTLAFTGVVTQSTDRVINLAGTTGGGAIDASGAGDITFTSNLTVTGAGAKTLTLQGTSTGGNAFSGAIVDGSGTVGLTKDGTGTWTLDGSAANTYTGTTTISGGTLVLAKSGAAAAVSNSVVIGDGTGTDILKLGASNQVPATASVTFNNSGGSPTLNLNGVSQTVGSIASTNTSAAIQLGSPGSATNFTVGDSSSTTFAGVISGGANAAFTKQGTGTLTLTGTNTFTGPVAITAGTLSAQNNAALGAGSTGTTVSSGAALALQGGVNVSNGTLNLTGTGVSNSGALYNASGTNMWTGNLALTGNTTIGNPTDTLSLGNISPSYPRLVGGNPNPDPPTDTNTLALGSNTLTFTGAGTTEVNTRITGTGNVVVDASGGTIHYYANQNTYTGTTTVKAGTLAVDTTFNTYPNDPIYPNYFGINGPLVIGDGVGSAGSAVLKLFPGTTGAEVIDFNQPITINSDGRFWVQPVQSIGALTFNGGTVDVSTAGGLYLNDTVTVNALAGQTATITGSGGSLSLTIQNGDASSTNRIFNVVGGVGNTSDLTIGALINNGSFTKNGAGTMTITSDNTLGYGGTTTINNGVLNIQHNAALGQASGTDANGTTVSGNGTTNGTLQLQGGITVSNEKLTLNSTGFNNNGALQNVSGNNTWAGPVALASDSRIQSDANLLTISGAVTSGMNANLDVRGSGNTTISGAIGTGTGGITKYGTGTLIVSGNNTYSGTTTISEGVVSLQHNGGLGSTGGSTTVASGAALQLDNTANGNLTTLAEPLFLSGTGVSGTGALRNASGTNTFAGLVTLSSDSLITANSGTTLTLSGGTASTGAALTIGTTAQNGDVTISGSINNGSAALAKNGSGTLTFTGSSGTVGVTHLNAGSISVGGSSTLNTGAFDAAAGTTLLIASGGTVISNYASGTTYFSGAISGDGEFQKTGAGTLVFDSTFTASNLTLTLNGGTLSLLGGQFTFGTIHITGNTVLDFNNSAGTFLSSASLLIDAGVTVTVNNWISVANDAALSTVWYATNTINSGTLGGTDMVGGTPLNQIVFSSYNGLTATWVSGNHGGWFDHEIRPTPEPATYGAIFLAGCLALIGFRRFRRANSRA